MSDSRLGGEATYRESHFHLSGIPIHLEGQGHDFELQWWVPSLFTYKYWSSAVAMTMVGDRASGRSELAPH